MNVQVIASPDGSVVWTSGSLPGSAHDLTAACAWGILRAPAQAGILTLADKGYQGAEGPVATPYKGRNKPLSQKAANRSHARLRGPGERANAQLKSWRAAVKEVRSIGRVVLQVQSDWTWRSSTQIDEILLMDVKSSTYEEACDIA